MKAKILNSPWIRKEMKKSSRNKKHLYKNFLKTKQQKDLYKQNLYKQYKTLFEKKIKKV